VTLQLSITRSPGRELPRADPVRPDRTGSLISPDFEAPSGRENAGGDFGSKPVRLQKGRSVSQSKHGRVVR
jgi:hypothetical protein